MTDYNNSGTHIGINRAISPHGVSAMRSGWVQRYHVTAELNGVQNNAEHQWRVATLLKMWCPSEIMDENLLQEALWHDAGELVTGDIPGPSKTMFPKLRETTKPIETTARVRMGLPRYALSDLQRQWLQFADQAECIGFVRMQRPDLLTKQEWVAAKNQVIARGFRLGLLEEAILDIIS